MKDEWSDREERPTFVETSAWQAWPVKPRGCGREHDFYINSPQDESVRLADIKPRTSNIKHLVPLSAFACARTSAPAI
jgi:hypothetical protein